jgi:hypothetical protein
MILDYHLYKGMERENLYAIYTLRNEGSNDIFYVGCTKNLKNRLLLHIKRFGFVPCMEVIETVYSETGLDARNTEVYWIHQFLTWGFNLKNICHSPQFLKHQANAGFAKEVYKPKRKTPSPLLSRKDVCERLKINENALRSLVVKRSLKYFFIGKAVRFTEDELNRFIKESTESVV